MTISVTVHTDLPPPPRAPNSTRFVCISDTHSRLYEDLPAGDILIHAGDLTNYGTEGELVETLQWLKSQPHPVKIVVAGNHDFSLDLDHWSATRDSNDIRRRILDRVHRSTVTSSVAANTSTWDRILGSPTRNEAIEVTPSTSTATNFIYLQHETATFTTEGGKIWKVYGSPSAPRYADGAFQYTTEEEAENIYSAIPNDIDIIVTHTPAYETLDKTRRGKHVGCPVLARRIEALNRCRLHVFGHIHESHGAALLDRQPSWVEGRPDLVAVNAAMYSSSALSRAPIVVDLIH